MVPWSHNCTSLFEVVSRVTGFDLRGFHRYRQLREQGLYRQALTALTSFMQSLALQEEETLRQLTDGLCHVAWARREAEELLPALLVNTMFIPCFERWRSDDPYAVAPRRWIGIHCWDNEALQRAREIDPEETIAREVIIDRLIERIDFLPRHLPELDTGSLRLVHRWAARARSVAREIPIPARRDLLLGRITEAVHVVETWTAMLSVSGRRETPLFAPERYYERD